MCRKPWSVVRLRLPPGGSPCLCQEITEKTMDFSGNCLIFPKLPSAFVHVCFFLRKLCHLWDEPIVLEDFGKSARDMETLVRLNQPSAEAVRIRSALELKQGPVFTISAVAAMQVTKHQLCHQQRINQHTLWQTNMTIENQHV